METNSRDDDRRDALGVSCKALFYSFLKEFNIIAEQQTTENTSTAFKF